MENQNRIDEKVKIFMRSILSKMVPAAFGPSTNAKMRDELGGAIEDAIKPILVKYDYIVEEESTRFKVKGFNEYLEEMSTPANTPGMGMVALPGNPGSSDQFVDQKMGSGDIPEEIYKKRKKKKK